MNDQNDTDEVHIQIPDEIPTGGANPFQRSKLKPRSLLATYEIGKKIGRGGYANVYQAIHTISRKEVALKIFDTEGRPDKDII